MESLDIVLSNRRTLKYRNWNDILTLLYFDGPVLEDELPKLSGLSAEETFSAIGALQRLELTRNVYVCRDIDFGAFWKKPVDEMPPVKRGIDLDLSCRPPMEALINHNLHRRDFELPPSIDLRAISEREQIIIGVCRNMLSE